MNITIFTQAEVPMTSILVVDDENDNVEVLCEYLELLGLDVIGRAHNGREARELYEEIRPDVVLSDVLMPDFDGHYGLEKILEFDPHANVIILTASAVTPTERNRLKDMGALAVIQKPYEMNDVLKVIENIGNNIIS